MLFNCLLLASSLLAGGDTTDIFDQSLENVLESVELSETTDISELTEHLEIYRFRPLNLNTATLEQLEKLGLLNDFQIAALLQYRLDYGDLADVSELQYVPGFTSQTITILQPYIAFQKTETFMLNWPNIRKFGKSDLMMRHTRGLTEKQGFSNNIVHDTAKKNAWYLGSPDVLWLRYQFNAMNKLRISFAADKDAGEELFKRSQKHGFPFYSGYVAISDVGRVKTLVVGNYQLKFGQGLCLWSGFSFGKSIDGSLMKKKAQGVNPTGSSSEYGYLQGIATTLKFGNIDVSTFFSYRRLDATVSNRNENGLPQSISAIIETGCHRTIGELEKKHTAKQMLYGTHVDRRWSRFRIGATAHFNGLNVDYTPQIRPDNRFSIPPKTNFNVGLDWEGIGAISRYYGEFAMSLNGGKAVIAGSRFLLNQRLSANISARYYEKNYQNFFADGLSENSGTANEKGLNAALFAELSKTWKVAVMTDLFEFPWLSYSLNEPLYGQEYQLKLYFTPNSRIAGYAHYRYKTKQSIASNADAFQTFGTSSKQRLRLHFDYKISENMTLKQRLEGVLSKHQTGFLMYQDLQYKFRKSPVALMLRYAVYNADDYDLRMNVYENDVLYGSTSQNYYYNGSRFFILLQYQPIRKLTFWIKYANTHIASKYTVGNGLDEIAGRDKTEWKVQMRWKF